MPYGIKTYEIANKISNNQYGLENQLQTKTRINGLPPMRNQLEVNIVFEKEFKSFISIYKGQKLRRQSIQIS